MQLSRHFNSREFRGDNVEPLPRAYLRDARQLATEYLEPLRERFGPVRVTSGWRTRTRNAQVGGAPLSFHTRRRRRRGAAADIVAATGTPREWYEFLDGLGAPGLGLYSDHVHVDNRIGHARW